ncbi:endolytic transglycosylase MltG [Streptomyces fructofermentans]|uniref:endolytic transglycosylase MltG n=1 Tax=Streptomyces fructofermentans TaxID=152141 RepID=UPI0033FEFF08
MTEYGRGPGSEPWHPEDPLYGDGGWGGQEAQAAQSPYGGQPQHYPQQPQQNYDPSQQQQQQYNDWSTGPQSGYDPSQQQYAQGQQYAQDQQQYGGQHQQQYGGQHPQQYGGQGGQQYNGGWDQNQQQPQQPQVPYGVDPNDPYGGQAAAYGQQQPDYYRTPDAYPPPEPPSRRRAEPEPQPDWDPGPDQGEHAFFAGGDEDDDEFDDDDDPQSRRRGKGGKNGKSGKSGKGGKGEKKRRSGCACLVVTLVFAGGIGGVGYFGYQFYQNRFGSAPDFAGDGTSASVSITVPKGATGYVIGQLLKEAGVVKSVDAFVAAQAQNPKGDTIQPATYLLKKEMSAASAVELMLSPKSRDNLIIAEGERNAAVYKKIDKRLGLKSGTTKKVADKEWPTLGLPDWANDNKEIKDPLEGFLYPSSYPAAKGMKPKDVLKEMVDLSKQKYEEFGLEKKAKGLDLDGPLELLTVASLVQAEGKTNEDFRKMSEVVYNRLKPTNTETNQKLQFDSSFNYLTGKSNIDISESEINSNQDPYNTYTQRGLPPGPIGNPGEKALRAALSPTKDGWIYFVATDGVNKTEFAKTHDEFLRLKEKFNDSSG